MEYSYIKLFNDFKRFITPYRTNLIIALTFQIIASTVYLYWTYGFSKIVDFATNYVPGSSLSPLYLLAGSIILALFIRAVCMGTGRYILFTNTFNLARDIEDFALKNLSKVDISWHEQESAGNKVKRLESGVQGIRELFRYFTVRVVEISISTIGAVIIILRFDFFLSISIIGYALVHYTISSQFRKKIVQTRRERNLQDEKYSGLIFEIINNIRSVKVLDMSAGLIHSVKTLGEGLKVLAHRMIGLDQTNWSIRILWEVTIRVFLVIYIVHGIIDGKYEIGFLVLFYGYFSSITNSTEELSGLTQEIALAKTNAVRLAEMLRVPITIDNDRGKVSFPHIWNKILFKKLSFSYSENKALTDIDFEINRGEKIGIVGLSGAGKSTLFKLLLKEYEAGEGDVYIDETPLKKIKKTSYLEHVAAVLQETEVFNMSLTKNITLANSHEEKNTKLLEKALTTSHVKDFLPKLPLGAESVIGEKGVKLSGGERQRVGIARAIFKDPQILLLDEATSHLDVESEQKIQDSLHQFFKGITAIVIAHRLSTIKEMDRIIVIENGTIIEQGTFDELHAKDARFREFWDKQSQA